MGRPRARTSTAVYRITGEYSTPDGRTTTSPGVRARVVVEEWPDPDREPTERLKQALDQHGSSRVRRPDEEKSRAKERVFSIRSQQHRWDPKAPRPELWRQYRAGARQ